VKDNQKTLRQDIETLFEHRGAADFTEPVKLAHGRIESRRIWASAALNTFLDFPDVGQVFAIERNVTIKKQASHPRNWSSASPAKHLSKLPLNKFWLPTVAIGSLKMVVTTSLIPFMMKIEVKSELAMGRKI